MEQIKILIVEDEFLIAEDLKKMLEDLGYIVCGMVPSGDKAIDKIDEEIPDVILMDISLPGRRDGVETAKIIRSKRDIPIIYITAHAYTTLIERAKETVPYGYIIKPFEIRKLQATLEIGLHKHKIDKKLKENERQARGLLNAITETVVLIDKNGTILSCNKVLAKKLGKTVDQIYKKNIFNLLSTEESIHKKNQIDNVLALKKPVRFQNIYKKRIFDNNYYPLFDNNGDVEKIAIFAMDITEKRKLEEHELKTQKFKTIGTLAGGIAHDYNNLLSIIIGNLSLVETYAQADEKILNFITEAQIAATRAKALTHQLMTLDQKKISSKKNISISEFLIDQISLSLSGSNIKCQFDIPDDLWLVSMDQADTAQVFHALTTNVKESAPENGGKLWVSAKQITIQQDSILPLQKGSDYIKITFQDNGSGIASEHIHKIFDPYFSTKNRDSTKGTGLGLSLAHSIIEKHNGYISVESQVNKGTIFFIYLPVSKPVLSKEDKQNLNLKETNSVKRLLIMDDEPMIRKMLQKMLQKLNYDVEFSKEGSETIEIYQNTMDSGKPFDAVILDLTIRGGMGGVTTMQKLLEIDPNVKGIISSGHLEDPVITNSEQYGFKGSIIKPFNMNELYSQLQKILS